MEVVRRVVRVGEVLLRMRSYSFCAAACAFASAFACAAAAFSAAAAASAWAWACAAASAAAAAASSLRASCSRAESRSTGVPYFACSGEAATVASNCASGAGDMDPCGARSRVQATGWARPSRS